jgi:Mn-containing catalase
MTREITHMKAFAAALESMNRQPFVIGKIPPTAGLVNQYFNTSTGQGEDGEIDARGPWNQPADLQIVEAPAFQVEERAGGAAAAAIDDRTTSSSREPEMIEELLVEQLRDLLNAETQLVKALPKMAKASRSEALQFAFEQHLEDTKGQVERLKEVFGLLGVPAKSTPCRGMSGLLDEGDEVMDEAGEQNDVAADLALIAAAQKIEHYEISAYGTARTMAGQAGLPLIGELLSKSLAEEEVADNLMSQIARELMSEARTGMTKAPKHARAGVSSRE